MKPIRLEIAACSTVKIVALGLLHPLTTVAFRYEVDISAELIDALHETLSGLRGMTFDHVSKLRKHVLYRIQVRRVERHLLASMSDSIGLKDCIDFRPYVNAGIVLYNVE
jgi:hypothetical protein